MCRHRVSKSERLRLRVGWHVGVVDQSPVKRTRIQLADNVKFGWHVGVDDQSPGKRTKNQLADKIYAIVP